MDLDDARTMARELLAAHGLHDWTFTFDRAKRRAGLCLFGSRTISLSRHLTALHSPDQVRDTLLHEIAHALAGAEAGHGPTWRAIASRIGASPQRNLPADAPLPEAPWRGRCPGGHEHHRYRRPVRPVSCSHCCPQFCMAHLITWTRGGQPLQPTPTYRRSLVQSKKRAGASPCPRCGVDPSRAGRPAPAP